MSTFAQFLILGEMFNVSLNVSCRVLFSFNNKLCFLEQFYRKINKIVQESSHVPHTWFSYISMAYFSQLRSQYQYIVIN